MRVFVFQSRRDPLLVAFSRDASGKNLPRKLRPWIKGEGTALSVGGQVEEIGSADPVIAAIEERGFYVGRAKVERARLRH